MPSFPTSNCFKTTESPTCNSSEFKATDFEHELSTLDFGHWTLDY
jgi:hypothetical protein